MLLRHLLETGHISRTENGENASCFAVLPDRALFLTGWRGKAGLFSVPLEGNRQAEPLSLPFGDITGFA